MTSRDWPEGSLFKSYYNEMLGRVLLLSLDCCTLLLILTLWWWVLSKATSSTIFCVFGMTRPGIEPWSPRPLANTLLIGLVSRVFANGPWDLGSIPGHVIPKTLKMALDTSLLNTQPYKVRIKGQVEQSRERSSALLYTSV